MNLKKTFLAFVCILTVILLAISLFNFSIADDGWTRVASGGFGDSNNKIVTSSAVYNSALYVGTRNLTDGGEVWRYNGAGWTQVNESGFGNKDNIEIASLVSFNGKLYAATENQAEEGGGAEVWEYDGTNWIQVDEGNFKGENMMLRIDAMIVFDDKLYVGANYGGETGSIGAQIWTYDGSAWERIMEGGFGSEHTRLLSFAIYNSKLYVGTQSTLNSAQVWRYDGGTNWTQVNKDGFEDDVDKVYSLEVYNGKLYAGVRDNGIADAGGYLWEYSGSGDVWVKKSSRIDSALYDMVLIVYGQNLYIATDNALYGSRVYLYNGTNISPISEYNFSTGKNAAIFTAATYQRPGGSQMLYVGTGNDDGAEVWAYYPPSTSTPTSTPASTPTPTPSIRNLPRTGQNDW